MLLLGRVHAHNGGSGPVIVAAYAGPVESGSAPTQVVRLDDAGAFELILPDAGYRLVAFRDVNLNGMRDPRAACGHYLGVTTAWAGWPVFEIDLEPAAAVACQMPAGTSVAVSHGKQAGKPGVQDDMFRSNPGGPDGPDGYWTPGAFLRAAGAEIFFVEPFDPARTPVLFVHGAAGSPQDWRQFIAGLDRSRYQAWLFHYPSGAALDVCAALLSWKLADLQARLHVPTLVIIAHSMGGLIVRKLLVRYGEQLPMVKLLLTLSTPWGGDAWDETGVRLSPAVVPSWYDMAPRGAFIDSLFSHPLPAAVEHHLFFSYRQRPGRPQDGGDGTVTLASQLSWRAQRQATSVRGFDEDHDSILSSPVVLRHAQNVLDAAQASGLMAASERR